jgi:hypothetical protein
MSAAAAGRLGQASLYGALVATAAFVAVSLSFRIFRRTFVRSLAQTRAVQTAAPNALLARWLGAIASPLPGGLDALVLKEWLVFLRDLRRLAGAMWPVGIVLVYTILLGRGGDPDLGSETLDYWSRNGVLALLPWGLSLGISVYSYGSEGRNVQLLRALPISSAKLFLVKVLASLAVVGAIGLGAATLSLWLRGAPLLQSIELIGVLLWMAVGFVTIDTAAAALAPNFETDQVQRTIGLTGRLFSVVVGGVFALATVAAAGRLVLMTETPPASIAEVLTTTVGGLEPFGWPLVVAATAMSLGAVTFSALLAIQQTERIILARP